MEEDVGVKVSVTRLRRRLSVEQSEDVSSPGASTPTKKRGGRLAAKPQLELIEENEQISSPRKTRKKSLATDAEEKTITPSRRSARIKSNSSIVSETLSVQATDSPRAKRAARRNSQAGSDNEGPGTPARQTRRTRKDSASSVENQGSTTPARQTRRARKDSASSVENQDSGSLSKPLPVAEMVIEEEPENETQKEVNKSKSSPTFATEELSPNRARKSTRLSEKRNRRSGSHKIDQDCSTCSAENNSFVSTTQEKEPSETESISRSPLNKSVKPKESNDPLSESNMSLLKKLDNEPKTDKSNHNKSASALNAERNNKSKRNRTESWPIVTTTTANDNITFSDDELSKKKKEKSDPLSTSTHSPKINKSDSSINKNNTSQSPLDTSSKRKKRKSETSSTKGTTDDLPTIEGLVSKEDSVSIKETSKDEPVNPNITSDVAMLFDDAPGKVQAIVYFEDSDVNSVDTGIANKIGHLDSEDQCVPVIKHYFQENLSLTNPTAVSNTEEIVCENRVGTDDKIVTGIKSDINTSCEPMDIDETIEEEILQKSRDSLEQSKTEGNSLSLSQHTTTVEDTDKSRRKLSISNSAADTLDRSKDDNKSTLILSQIKDVSSTSENPNSPKPTNSNEILSKSDVNIHGKDSKKVSKGNLSLNDVKETPKQKSIQKLTMQTSTPIITQLDIKTKEVEQSMNTNKNNKSNFSKSINDSDSSEDDTDDDLSMEKNQLLNNEAEEASDDYESGDSQDEEQKRYEAENNIVERGETLTSDDDMSNDTDYEKDSFVVSSDLEDNELLSGSGDDLDMSDNELSMNKKSKKKYNERKLKAQKKASREMFESRHKLNTSEQKSPTPKTKKNRMRIDSSLLPSDEEVAVKPKKNNRMRLNSTLETCPKQEDGNISLDKSEKKDESMQDFTLDTSVKLDITKTSPRKSKKTNKSVPDSVDNKSTIDEKEITVCNESAIDDMDPLQVHLKQEPKTPQKDLNISVIQFTDRQEIENVQVTESNYILNQTGTDPLQATMAYDESSDSSGNEEIMQNYDSVLNELNKDKKTKFNKNNISLNMENKAKKKNRPEPIIDQLNLTHTKKSNKNKDRSQDNLDSKRVEGQVKSNLENKPDSDSEDCSNSIDFQLLFPEDNCGSEDEHIVSKTQQSKADDDSMFIPLKKSPGKTNIQESIDVNISQPDLNESCKKKNKRKSSLVPTETIEAQDINTSQPNLNESSKKKNKRKSSLLPTGTVEEQEDSSRTANETLLNKSSSKKDKQRTSLALESAEEPEDGVGNESIMSKGSIKKKKHKASLTAVESQELEVRWNVSLNETGSKKKKKHSISEPAVEDSEDMNKSKNISLNESGVKKKKKHSLSEPTVEESQEINAVELILNESIKKKKKKNRKSSLGAQDSEQTEGNLFFIDTTGTLQDTKETTEESNPIVTPKSEKKKGKKISQKLESTVCDDDSDGAPDEAPYLSEKATEAELQNTETVSKSLEPGSAKKKKKKKKKKSPTTPNQSGQSIGAEDSIPSQSNKRKRKSSNADGSGVTEEVQENAESGVFSDVAGSHKKKRKISHNEENNTSGSSEAKFAKKKKKNHDVNYQHAQFETTEMRVKKNKKRKHRDEDVDNKQTKVSKDSSFQEVHVQRLPDSVLRQLDDKPKKITAPNRKLISTSNFVVENARQKRVKPSKYLEESVYLHEDSPKVKKEKSRIKKPKVLPFVPTASISDSGFTTNFKINTPSHITKFEAETVGFSKESYLQKKGIKKLGTYDRYKKQMHHKISKF